MAGALGLLAGAAAGYAQAKRQKQQDDELREYRADMKAIRSRQFGAPPAASGEPELLNSVPEVNPMRLNGIEDERLAADGVKRLARGGTVGVQQMTEQSTFDCWHGSTNDGGWQRGNYKK